MPETYNVVPQKSIDEQHHPEDAAAAAARKKSSIRIARHGTTCEKCGHINTPTFVYPVEIYPPPRPVDRIRPDNRNFIGYVLLVAIFIVLFYVAMKTTSKNNE